jgi:hypothetical protein
MINAAIIIKVLVPNIKKKKKKSERLCIYVSDVDFVSVSAICDEILELYFFFSFIIQILVLINIIYPINRYYKYYIPK